MRSAVFCLCSRVILTLPCSARTSLRPWPPATQVRPVPPVPPSRPGIPQVPGAVATAFISSSRLPDQQNFNVSVENMLTRCLDNQRSWQLHCSKGPGLLIEDSPSLGPDRKADTVVFPCILSALQWIAQGRDSVLARSSQVILPVKSSIEAKAAPLRSAAEIHVLITGSLHLVGGVLKHFDQPSSK